MIPAWLAAWCLSKKVPYPVAEFRFHPKRKWRLDFAWEKQRVAIELHGAVYQQGRHTRGKGFEDDREKMNTATLMGWKVIEVTTGQVKSGLVYDWLTELLT